MSKLLLRCLSLAFFVAGCALAALGATELLIGLHGQWRAMTVWNDAQVANRSWHPPGAQPQPEPEVFARLELPRLQQSRFVLGSATDENLMRGPAWLNATAKPGKKGNCIIAGHRDLHFRFFKDAKVGDEIRIDQGSESYRYRIRAMTIVPKTDVRLLRQTPDPTLTIVTCYPFYYLGNAPKRMLIQADLLAAPAPVMAAAN